MFADKRAKMRKYMDELKKLIKGPLASTERSLVKKLASLANLMSTIYYLLSSLLPKW